MSINDTSGYVKYIYSSANQNYDGADNCAIFQETDVVVKKKHANLDYVTLTLGDDYVVTINEDNTFYITITNDCDIEDGDILLIYREVPYSRQDDYEVNGLFTGQQLDKSFDRIVVLLQQVKNLLLERGLTYAATEDVEKNKDTILPVLGIGQIWKKSDTGYISAVTLEENTNCSTLRSELLNNQPNTDGSRIVGYNDTYNGAITVHNALEKSIHPVSSNIGIIRDYNDDSKVLYFNISNFSPDTTHTIFMENEDVHLGRAQDTQEGLIQTTTNREAIKATSSSYPKCISAEKLRKIMKLKNLFVAHASLKINCLLYNFVILEHNNYYDYNFHFSRNFTYNYTHYIEGTLWGHTFAFRDSKTFFYINRESEEYTYSPYVYIKNYVYIYPDTHAESPISLRVYQCPLIEEE